MYSVLSETKDTAFMAKFSYSDADCSILLGNHKNCFIYGSLWMTEADYFLN